MAKRKAHSARDQKVREASKKIVAQYFAVFKALAETPVDHSKLPKMTPKERLKAADRLVKLSQERRSRDPVILDRETFDLLIQVAKDAASVADIRGCLCPACGRNNSDYGCVCTADDCPGVMAIKAANIKLTR